jgi:cyclic beta-1,2-glucan synthetase
MANLPSDPNSAADQASAANISRMEDLARQQVENQAVAPRSAQGQPPAGKPSLLNYLDEQSALLQSATQRFRETPEKESLSYAAEWMLDNFYLVQQTLRQILEDMPPEFYRQLPKLVAAPLAGYPRVYAVAQELVVIQTAHLDLDRVKRFIQLYQDITPLTMGELWALPVMLRLSSIECLAQAITRITGLVRKNALPTMTLPRDLTDDEIVANCIISLRTLATQDWQEFFESVSRVEQVLCGEPTGIYARMDRETRDSYRKVVEDLARSTGRSEQEVAREAVSLASEGHASTERTAHVGYYLVDAGRAQLEVRLGYHPAWRERLRRWVFRHPTSVYLGGMALISLAILLGGIRYAMSTGATLGQWIGAGLLLLIPAVTVSVSLVNWIVTRTVPPRILPKMNFTDGIPAEYRTIVVVPAMLTSAAEVESLVQQLELHYLRNQDPHLYFALLTDLPDASQLRTSGEHPLVEQAESGIRRLNEKYHRETSSPFYLFHRDPKWNPREEQWMGWERKRGKLHELNHLLRGNGETAFSVQTGNVQVLHEIKYVITLDADTIMPRGAAHRLVATLAHPLNHAEFDPPSGRVGRGANAVVPNAVIAGYTLLQPGIEITSPSANLSRFTRIFAGDVGLDLYTRAVSNTYQDLFGEGIYVGKGIYDIDAFERSLAGRMPENALLSHDLIEGIHGRVGLVTDVVLYEEYPPHYFVYLRRSRRWIRGDWQLLPWLLPRVPSVGKGAIPNTLSVIDRWKILDNLRRSLLSPALFVLFVAGWLWLPGSPLVWTLVGLLTPAVPVLTGLIVGLVQGMKGRSWQNALRPLHAERGAVRWMLALVFLPYETLVTLGGVVTTLLRLLVTRRHLLQWTTYSDTVRLFAGEMTWQQRLTTMLVAVALTLLTLWFNPAALFVAMPFLIAWLFSPQIAYWISRPIRHAPEPLSTKQNQVLRNLARRTWLFFERFVGPEDHWLPPDHFQESPRGVITPSTSPTNIGLLLLSTLAAYDLGYIELLDLVTRLRATFESMEKLERYRGHFLNWYDTRSLAPLPPRYVSTVDSGNLAACLRTLGQGCLALLHAPLLRRQTGEGLLDTLGLLEDIVQDLERIGLQPAVMPLKNWLAGTRKQVAEVEQHPDAWAALLSELVGQGQAELDHLLMSLVESHAQDMDTETLRRLRISVRRAKSHLESAQNNIELMLPWLLMMSQPPRLFTQPDIALAIREAWQALRDALPTTVTLDQLPEVLKAGQVQLAQLKGQLDQAGPECAPEGGVKEACDWCRRLTEKLERAPMTARIFSIGLRELDQQAESYFQAMDFGFLFDSHRQMFHLGYNVDAGKLDSNYYDLLASEARIASIVAIAKNDVPPSHWLHLNRPLTQVDNTHALLSWSATMFEYLMPTLLIKSYDGTLLEHSCCAAVDYQIKYAEQKGVPWGISESGFYAFDASLNYQYRAFGVPGLGFKRNLAQDLVVAPYASLMALPLQPRKVMENIARLTELNMLGAHGFYEAIDFTPSRLVLGEKHAIVRSYMAHHQGMIMLSLINYLHDDVMVSRFHSDPRVQSVELLLQEKVPMNAPVELAHPEDSQAVRRVQGQITMHPWNVTVEAPLPQVHYLSNGRYGVLLTSAGSGFSRWQEADLTRWRADTTLDNWGTWIYVQDRDSGDVWSATYQPTAVAPASQSVQFYAHMAEFRRSDHGLDLSMQVVVAPDDDVEIRRVSLTNQSDRVRRLTLTSYGEVILAPQAADQRHPAFNKLFIESEHLPETALGTTALGTPLTPSGPPPRSGGHGQGVLGTTNALLFRRRPRSETEEPIYLAHSLVVQPGYKITGTHETDRTRFLGRGQTPHAFGHNTASFLSWSEVMAGQDLVTREPPNSQGIGSTLTRLQEITLAGVEALTGRDLAPTKEPADSHEAVPASTLPEMSATLDPIMSLSQEIELEPHETTQVTFITLAARSRQKALALCSRYQTSRAINQAFDQARSRAEIELRQLGLATTDLEHIQHLLSALVYPHAALRAEPAVLAANRKGQSGLWGWGISGDYPILLVRINNSEELGLIKQVLQAHTYWRDRQLKIDLVILDMQGTGYGQELRGQLQHLLVRANSESWLNQRGGIFILNADQMSEADRVLLETAARVVLDGNKGTLAAQLEVLHQQPTRLPPFTPTLPESKDVEPTPALARPTGLLFDNGLGGLTGDGREYVIYLEPGQWTPAPWINVIANPTFGFLVSEAGSSSTWAVNSSENRLTPWSNDPVTDPSGEALYLRDEETAQVWSPTPQPTRAPAPYLIRHGAGYSIFEHHSHGLKQELRLFVARDAPVKVIQLRLENVWERGRRITATFYVEWVRGVVRDASQQYVVSEFDNDSQALLVRNAYNAEFGERVAFVAASKKLHGLTADRAEFLGRMGSLNCPAALERIGLASAVQPGLDPCAAVQLHVDLGPGEAQEIFFLLGEAPSKAEALQLVKQYQDAEQVKAAWKSAIGFWEDVLGSVQVQTPDPAMNVLLNRWLLYQTLACRVWGRSAFYQASGAFGFRDQLQDVMALVHVAPYLAREHILESARQQFEAGDVLHWWHPPSGRGVRTRCSDDLLWLPFVTAHYIIATGDESILDEQEPFRKAALLGMGEDEHYGQDPLTGEIYTLYEHCRRALEKGTTAGPHGLPLIGSGDWNDGMNRVGSEGKGESVWLGWFLCATLNRWASLCDHRGKKIQAAAYRQRADELHKAIEANAWDGEWYLRAFYDDGTPLGAAGNLECQIDSIAQSWAVLSGAGDPARTVQAMQSVVNRLVNGVDAGRNGVDAERNGDALRVVLLFAPPFDKTPHDPGYIKGYTPGIRENGGQYTHAALWVAWAFAELGDGDRAEALFRLLNPIYHGDTPDKAARYKVEPYVVAADVYSKPPNAGRGGWTWYTGSAGWMYRLGLEAILGIHRVGQALQINPCIPKSWTGYQMMYREGETTFQIRVENPSGVNRGVRQVALDGKVLPGNEIPLLCDGNQHQAHVLMG